MAIIPYEILDKGYEELTHAPEFVAKAARNAFCSLDAGVRNAATAVGLGGVALPLIGDLTATICGRNPNTGSDTPSNPNTGGKCVGQLYDVTCVPREFYSPDTLDTRDYPLVGLRVYGPIDAVQLREPGTYTAFNSGKTSSGYNKVSVLCRGDVSSGGGSSAVWVDIVSKSDHGFAGLSNVQTSPIPGQTDTCGVGPTATYPPVKLPPGDITIPYPSGPVTAPWSLPKIILPPNLSFEPKLVVNIGEVNVVFDFSGAQVTLAPDFSVDFPVNVGSEGGKTLPGVPDALNDSIYNLNSRLKKLQKDLDALKDCVCPELQTLETNLIGQGRGGTFLLSPARNRYCAIAITTMPSNRKEQIATGSPNVVYAGWAWFGSQNGYKSIRLPVDCEGKVFKNDGHFDQFAYFLYKGFQANVYELNVPIPVPVE